MWLLFISAVGLGIAISAPPGPIATESLRRGAVRGFRAAFMVQAGSLIGDTVWAILALVGIAFLVQNVPARLILTTVGVVLLIRLGISALRDARSGRSPHEQPYAQRPSQRNDFTTGMLLSLANPFAIAFWLGIGSSVIAANLDPTMQVQPIHLIVFFSGFMLGVLAWMLLFCVVVGWGRRYLKPPLFRLINAICGLVLLLFGAQLAWSTLTSL
jgi:threonine/homoserine/homoserine lactone efflux protein